MDASDSESKSLEETVQEAEEHGLMEAEEVQTAVQNAEKAEALASEVAKAESEFMKSLEKFHAEQEKIIHAAQSMLPVQCSKCQGYIHSKKDKGCAAKNGCCFKCFTADQVTRTMDAESKIEASKYDLISTMDLSDYEEWLFDDELGRRTLARIVAKMKAQGYDYKPWQISIGAAAWSKENYTQTSLEDTRYLVERVKPTTLSDYVPMNPDGIKQVIDSVKRAEEIIGFSATPETERSHWPVLGGIAGISVLIPLLMRRR